MPRDCPLRGSRGWTRNGQKWTRIRGFCPLSSRVDPVPSPPAAVMSCWPVTAAGTRRLPPPDQAGPNPSADRCPSRLDPAQPASAATPRASASFGSLGLGQSVAAQRRGGFRPEGFFLVSMPGTIFRLAPLASRGFLLPEQSGEHSGQSRLTYDPRHPHCPVPDGGACCCPTRQ